MFRVSCEVRTELLYVIQKKSSVVSTTLIMTDKRKNSTNGDGVACKSVTLEIKAEIMEFGGCVRLKCDVCLKSHLSASDKSRIL